LNGIHGLKFRGWNLNHDTSERTSPNQPRTNISPFRLPRNVLALGLVSLFNDASSEIIYPLLPIFLTSTLGASLTSVGLIEGIAESVSSLLKLPAGWFSDRLRRRKALVVAGYGLAAAARPLLALTTSAWQVLGLRFVDRIGKGLRSAPRDAMIADAAGAEARGLAYGFHRAMDHAGAILGALISAWLIVFFQGDYRSVFWAASLPALAGLLILIFVVRETAPLRQGDRATGRRSDRAIERQSGGEIEHLPPSVPPSPHRPVSASPHHFFNAGFKKFLGVLLLFTLSNSSDAFLLLRAKERGVSETWIPLLWALLHASKSLSSVVGGGLSDRFGRKRLIVSGWVLYAAIYFGFALASTSLEMWLLFAIYGVYFGLTEGAEKALVADLVAPPLRGTAFGLYNLVIGIAALPASLLLGLLWQRFGAETAMVTGATLSLAAAMLLLTIDIQKKADA
jgi:MFS family permease